MVVQKSGFGGDGPGFGGAVPGFAGEKDER